LKVFAFLPVFFVLLIHFAFSQEETEDAVDSPEYTDSVHVLYDENSVFFINSVDFHITGITRQFALLDKGEINRGDEITGYHNLVKYVQDKQQLLYNQRALQSAGIEFTVGEINTDGKYPVDLAVTAKDSWNILALPRPHFNTNSGVRVTLNVRDYNFFGTLMPLRFDIGYRRDLQGRNYYSFMLDTDTPFRFLDLGWNFVFSNNVEYKPHFDEQWYYKNTAGLSVNLPLGKTTVVAGFRESLFVNQEYDDADKEHYGDTHRGLYLSSNPSVDWIIPTGVEAGRYGQIHYVPYINASIPHSLSPWPLTTECETGHVHDLKAFPILYFGHSLGFGRIDWKDDFKNGLSVNIRNAYAYYFREKHYKTNPWHTNIQLNMTGHFIFADAFIGLSCRFLYRHWLFSDIHTEAGDVMRGIPDSNVNANFMISFNMDFPVKVLKAKPAEWFGVEFFRYFNFDLHLSPVFDIAVFHHPVHQTSLSLNNFLVSGGLEAIFFPHLVRSLHLRIGAYLNLTNKEQSANAVQGGYNRSTAGKYEIYIGTDFHF